MSSSTPSGSNPKLSKTLVASKTLVTSTRSRIQRSTRSVGNSPVTSPIQINKTQKDDADCSMILDVTSITPKTDRILPQTASWAD